MRGRFHLLDYSPNAAGFGLEEQRQEFSLGLPLGSGPGGWGGEKGPHRDSPT